MKYLFSFFAIGLLFSFTSCIEIIDDLAINEDGSGTFKYTVNLSSSKIKLNSYLALDSLDGKRVPSLDEIKGYVDDVIISLKGQEGISNLTIESNYSDFIFKLKLDFNSVENLQAAIKAVAQENSKKRYLEELNHNWLEHTDKSLSRSIPKMNIDRASRLSPEETKLLKEGTYTSITRFSKEVDRCDNADAVLAKNKKAVMVRTDAYSLSQKNQLLDNVIHLK
ncbi:MAG: hypothetical protein AB8B56_02940 [Crocinitomicaceae bacterium]